MNYRNVVYQLGLLLLVLSAILLLLVAWSALRLLLGHDVDMAAFRAIGVTALLGGVAAGIALVLTRNRDRYIGRREAMLLVALTWGIGSAVAALPFRLWTLFGGHGAGGHEFDSFINCYFESVSGLTTTGATVLGDIQSLPDSLLLWRSLTHWLGGLGIVVLFVAVLPTLGVGAKRLFRVEATGPSPEGLQPTIRETARVLWLIYSGITVVAAGLLWLAGMSPFDATCHAFSMVSTGGLSTRDASIGHYDSAWIDAICIVFMVTAGINFALFYQATHGRVRHALRDPELRVYLATKALVGLVVVWNIIGTPITTTAGATVPGDLGNAVQHGLFTTVALHTGTGFGTADYDRWPLLSQGVLVGLMFMGGCAGSTAGGIKVIRFWIAIKVMLGQIEKAFRPQVVRPLRIGTASVDNDMKIAALAYIMGFFLILLTGAFLLGLIEHDAPEADFSTILTASLSSISNVGPGLHGVGATANYAWFEPESKLLLCLLMTLGRLELFALIVLFNPRFWRGT